MKILEKYITKNFILPLLYCLIVFYLLFVVANVLGHLDEILKNKVPIAILAQFYLSFAPLILVQTTPLAALLATVYLLSAMNKNNELTAMKASGINILSVMLPVLVLGVVLMLSIFYVNENIVPEASLITSKIKTEYIESNKKDRELKSIKNLTVYGKANQMIYAKSFDSVNNKLHDIIILEHDKNQKLKRKILAKEATWLADKWLFHSVIIYRFDEFSQPKGKVLTFDKKIIKMPDEPSDLLKGELMANYMNYPQLKTYIGRLKGGDKKTINRLKTDLYFKLSLPFCTFIMILLGIPFALTTARGGVASSIGISIVVGLIYYASIGISLALGKGGYLPPITAAHLPNVVFLVIALLLIRRAPA